MKNFILFLMLAAGLSAGYLYYQYNEAKKEVPELVKSLASGDQILNQRRAEFQSLVQAVELQQKIQARQKEISLIYEKENGLREKLASRTKKHAEIISAARQAVIGKVLPELTLQDGRKLTQVKILKADDSGLSIGLSSGIQKLPPASLPKELQQQLHYK